MEERYALLITNALIRWVLISVFLKLFVRLVSNQILPGIDALVRNYWQISVV